MATDINIYLLPKQYKFIFSNKTIKVFAGSFGTGKTTALVYDLLLEVIKHPGSISLLGRKTIPSLVGSTLKEFRQICPRELIDSENSNLRVIRFINGHELHYHPLDNSREANERIRSNNYGAIFVDQMEEIAEDMFLDLIGRMRNTRGSRQFRGVVNPNGHDWIWKRFVNRRDPDTLMIESKTWTKGIELPSYEQLKQKAKELDIDIRDLRIKDFPEYVKYTDNPLLPIDYIRNLLNAPETWRNRYVFCEWDAYSGLIYDEFDPEVHVVDPFPIPNSWFKIVSYDHGFRNPACFLFGAVDPSDGTVYIYDEIYESKMTVRQLKLMYNLKAKDIPIDIRVADPSIFQKAPGRDIADEFLNKEDGTGLSISFIPANNDLDYGIQIVKKFLTYSDNKKPKIKFFRGKTMAVIDEILEYRWKELKVTDQDMPEKPRKKDDHAMDALRYMLTFLDSYIRKFEKEEKTFEEKYGYMDEGVRPYMV